MHLPYLSRDKVKLYANFWKLYLFRFFINLYLIGPVFLAFYQDFAGLSFKYMMFAQAWYMLWIFLLEIPSGIVADSFGRKKTLILATILNCVAIFVYSLYPNFYIFLVAEFLWAVSFVLFSGTDDALAYDSLKQIGDTHRSVKVFSKMESFAYFGILIATPLGGILADSLGPRMIMMVMTIPYVFAFLIAISLKEAKVEEPIGWRYYFHNFKYEFRLFKANKILLALAFDLIFLYILVYPMIWLYLDILSKYNLSISYLGFVYAGWVVLSIILMNSFDIFESIFKSKRAFLTISGIIVAVMFFLLAFFKSLPILIIALIIGCAFGFSRRPLLINYMNKHIPSHKRATLLSSISMIENFFLSFITSLIGIFSENWVYPMLIILGFLAIIFTLFSSVKEDHLID